MPSCTIFTNSNAGILSGPTNADEMRKLVAKFGLDADVLDTGSEEEMCEAIRRLQGHGVQRVVVVGGDGTIHAAAQCLAGTETELGIIPHGTHNNFSHAL